MDRISINTISQVIQRGATNPLQELAEVAGISIDSRTAKEDDLFFAIQGKRFDHAIDDLYRIVVLPDRDSEPCEFQ